MPQKQEIKKETKKEIKKEGKKNVKKPIIFQKTDPKKSTKEKKESKKMESKTLPCPGKHEDIKSCNISFTRISPEKETTNTNNLEEAKKEAQAIPEVNNIEKAIISPISTPAIPVENAKTEDKTVIPPEFTQKILKKYMIQILEYIYKYH